MHTHTWTMDDAGAVFGGPAALAAALDHLHATITRLAPRHGGVAIAFDDVGDPIVGPTIGRGPFLPGTHTDGEGRLFHGWLQGASAHARLACAAGFDAARALWALVEAFHPDLHPTDLLAFALVGAHGDPRLVLTSGPLRTGPAGAMWSQTDVRLPLRDQIAVLWGAAIRATHSHQRFLTGHAADTLRAASLDDLHHALHAVGHATAWAVGEPLRLDGLARQLDHERRGWHNTASSVQQPSVRAVGSALETLLARMPQGAADTHGLGVWQGEPIGHSWLAQDGAARHAVPSPLGGMAKRALRRLADALPLFGTEGLAWGAQPRVVWTRDGQARRWYVRAQTAGMVFDVGPTLSWERSGATTDALDPWAQAPCGDPWWAAYHHQDGKRSQPRLFQAPDVEAAGARCLKAAKAFLHTHNGWSPFHHRQLLLWPVVRPTLPPTTQDTAPWPNPPTTP